jgi:hypothetical protein
MAMTGRDDALFIRALQSIFNWSSAATSVLLHETPRRRCLEKMMTVVVRRNGEDVVLDGVDLKRTARLLRRVMLQPGWQPPVDMQACMELVSTACGFPNLHALMASTRPHGRNDSLESAMSRRANPGKGSALQKGMQPFTKVYWGHMMECFQYASANTETGEVIAIVGKTGSGKSYLAREISQLSKSFISYVDFSAETIDESGFDSFVSRYIESLMSDSDLRVAILDELIYLPEALRKEIALRVLDLARSKGFQVVVIVQSRDCLGRVFSEDERAMYVTWVDFDSPPELAHEILRQSWQRTHEIDRPRG